MPTTNFDRSSAHERQLHVHDEAEHRRTSFANESVTQARQTIERRVNELGVAEPSIAQQGGTATRSSSSCRV